ncbi:FxLYD domain-containing protein [Streptomyces sp. O3]
MRADVVRSAAAVVLVVGFASGAAGCSDGDGSPSYGVSRAVDAATSAASRAADAVASATAEAARQLESVKEGKGGVDAEDAVRLGEPGRDDDGRSTVSVTADNAAQEEKSFAVRVDFLDASGNLLDTVVVTVADVAAGETGQATARSTRKLEGDVKVDVGTALRY